MRTRTVAVLAYEGAQLLDVTAPAEVFSLATAMADGAPYRVVIVSADGRDTVSSSGLPLGVQAALGDLDGEIDTFVVPGTWSWPATMHDLDVRASVLEGARRSRRLAGVCAGVFLLGGAGLLEGRRATTHWQFLDELVDRFPAVEVEREPIFVRDGDLYTSSGGTAGIDLALALVEADHGPALAREVARFLVVFMQRPGGQTQFSVRMKVPSSVGPSVRDLLDGITADPAADHRLAALSARAGFSERHLARLFTREVGRTPARYVEEIRIEAARAMLETSDAGLEVVARECGLGTAETLRRSFARVVGITPHAYRRRFRTTGVDAVLA